MMKTWVVVASAARARLFEVGGRHDRWTEVADLVNPDDRLARQAFTSDEPGRAVNSARGQHHTMEPTIDPKERAAVEFARELVGKLESGLYEKQFAGLIVVAPPHFLGLLREHMSAALGGVVQHEIGKDLTREEARSLQAHVAELL
jgi:protein required for attachment to host cells